MKGILEDLWYGRIAFDNSCIKPSKEAKELMCHMSNYRNDLQTTLTEAQKETMERYNDCHTDLVCMNEREIFKYAFRLGARIALEIMSDTDE